MPRRVNPEDTLEHVQHLPVPVPATHKERQHRVDAYRPFDGGVPVVQEHVPKRRGRRRKDELASIEQAEAKRRSERYDRFLDALIALGGDTDSALAIVYGISVQEATERHDELHADVLAGVPTSSISEMLERRDLSQAARLTLLRRHAFSPNPAASLKALDMLAELDSGRGQDAGTYEQYVRLAMAQD